MGDGDTHSWIGVIEALEKLRVETVAPGHGPPTDRSLLGKQKAFIPCATPRGGAGTVGWEESPGPAGLHPAPGFGQPPRGGVGSSHKSPRSTARRRFPERASFPDHPPNNFTAEKYPLTAATAEQQPHQNVLPPAVSIVGSDMDSASRQDPDPGHQEGEDHHLRGVDRHRQTHEVRVAQEDPDQGGEDDPIGGQTEAGMAFVVTAAGLPGRRPELNIGVRDEAGHRRCRFPPWN